MANRDPFLGSPGIPVLNGTGEEVPPYGVVRLVTSADGVRTISKPTIDDDPHVYINGGGTIHKDVQGRVHFLPLGPVAYDPADGEPAINEVWGPRAGSFLLRKGNLGFRIAGEADGTTVVVARVIAEPDLIVRVTGSVKVAAGSGGSDCEGSAFEADASGEWPSGVGELGSGVGHNAYTGYLQRRECLLDPWEDYGDEVYIDDMNGRPLVVGDRYQVVRQGAIGGIASYTTRDDPAGTSNSGDSGDSGDSGSGSGDDDCVEVVSIDCPASGSGAGSGGDECILVGAVTISESGGVCTGTFTINIPTRSTWVKACNRQSGGS